MLPLTAPILVHVVGTATTATSVEYPDGYGYGYGYAYPETTFRDGPGSSAPSHEERNYSGR